MFLNLVNGKYVFKGSRICQVYAAMRTVVILVGLLTSVGLAGGPKNGHDDVFRFMTYYYLRPAPEKLPTMLKDFLALGWFADDKRLDATQEYQYAYFFARASESDPNIVENYMSFFESGTHEQRGFILRILELCGNENTKYFFETNLRMGRFSQEQPYITQALEEGFHLKFDPTVEQIRNASDLDFLWTEFMITGSKEVVKRIVSILHRAKNGEGPEITIGSAAKWSLAANCRIHERVLDTCWKELSKSNTQTKKMLQRIIDEVEIYKILKKNEDGTRQENPKEVMKSEVIVTGSKAWALGCTAVVVERDHYLHDLLGMNFRKTRAIVKAQKFLGDPSGWNINSRAVLLDKMVRLCVEGDRKRFEQLGMHLVALSKEELASVLEDVSKDRMSVDKILNVLTHYKKLGERGILGWDYSRIVWLCRWGYMAGYISEEETWEIVMAVAKMLQKQFDSWEDLGRNYLIGRKFRLYEEMKDTGYTFEDAYQRLLDMPSSPWNKYPWEMSLNTSHHSNSVATPSGKK